MVALATTGVVDARAPIGAPPARKVALAGTADRRGWFYITDYAREHLRALEAVPGVRFEPTRILVPLNLVLARSDLFEVVYDPAQLARAPAADPALMGRLPRELAAQDSSGGHLEMHDWRRLGMAHLLQPTGAILADAVGTGKTLVAACAARAAGYQRVLVAGSLATRAVWCGERSDLRRWLGVEVTPLEGMKDKGLDGPAGGGWRFVHYDLIRQWFPYLTQSFRPDCVILDEAHQLKGHRTQRARATLALVRLSTVRSRMVLTATQVRRDLGNLWTLLDAAQPDQWGKHFEFRGRYDHSARGPYGGLYGEDARQFLEEQGEDPDEQDLHEDELDARLRATLLRREQDEVQADLPRTVRTVVDVDLDLAARDAYSEVERDVVRFLRERGGQDAVKAAGAHLQQITQLCSLLSEAKVPSTVAQAIEDVGEHGKLVVFTWFKDAAARIAQALAKHAHVFGPTTGDTPQRVRAKRAREFREYDGTAAFVATLASCGESINDLVAARVGIMHDLYWEPTPFVQGEGRLRRTGQDRTVLWRYMRARGTIEDHQADKLLRAAETVERALGGRAALSIAGAVGASGTGAPEADPLDSLIADLLAARGGAA